MDLVSIENLRYSELYKNIKSVKIVHMMILTSAQLVTHPSFHLFHKPDPAHASEIFDRGERQRRVLYMFSGIFHLIRAWEFSRSDGDVQNTSQLRHNLTRALLWDLFRMISAGLKFYSILYIGVKVS
jgi:hypothetical protein